MDGYKEIHTSLVRFHGFLIRGFVYVCRAGVQDVDPAFLKNLANGKRQGKGVVFFLPSVKDSSGIAAAVPGI